MKGEPKRQAPECSVFHKLSSASFSPPAPPSPCCSSSLFNSFFYPSLHAVAFESGCSGCFGGRRQVREEAKSSTVHFALFELRKRSTVLVARVCFSHVTISSSSEVTDVSSISELGQLFKRFCYGKAPEFSKNDIFQWDDVNRT